VSVNPPDILLTARGERADSGGRQRRLRFLETLGRGGFGAVYLAEVHNPDRFVQRLAIKVLSAEMNDTADFAARQRDEARLLARLNHDNIVKVFDLTTIHGRPAVMMEYVEGVDAAELLRHGPIPPRAAFQIVAAAASALHAAWTTAGPRADQPLRVVHRDIKPANLLISRHGGVKVLDFGVARADFDREGKTESMQFGTARFMAPEQWLYGQVGHGVDIYALGISLAEILVGANVTRAPLAPERHREHVEAIAQALQNPLWPPEAQRELDALILGMLAFRPEDRPDAGAVHERAQNLADLAPGEGLGRYATRLIPPLIEGRRERFRNDPMLDAVSVPYEEVSIPTDEARSSSKGPESPPRSTTSPPPRPPSAAASGPSSSPALPSSASTVPLRAARVGEALGAPLTAPEDSLAIPQPDHRRPARSTPRLGLITAVAGLTAIGLLGAVGAALWALSTRDTPQAHPLGEGVVAPAPAQGPEAPAAETAEAPPAEPARDAGSAASPPSPAAAARQEGRAARPAHEGARQDLIGSLAESRPPADSLSRPPVEVPAPARVAATSEPQPEPRPEGKAEPRSEHRSEPRSESPPPSAAPTVTTAAAGPSAPPAAEVALYDLNISASQVGATILLDGAVVGQTPKALKASAGEHSVQLRLGDKTKTVTVNVSSRRANRFRWNVETNQWETLQ
jgi:serine/threonine protein kinase